MKIATYVLLGILILLQYPLWLGDGGLLALSRLEREIRAQKQENARLVERNQTLEAQVQDLKQGIDVVEGRARSELGMVKKGEVFYRVIEPQTASTAPAKTSPAKK